MKRLPTLFVFFFSAVLLFGQAPAARKLVEIKSNNPDSIVTTDIKRDKQGKITKFTEDIKNREGALIYSEYYTKGKDWRVTEYTSSTAFHASLFSPEGLILGSYYEDDAGGTSVVDLSDGKRSYSYAYYPNQKLMLKLEERITNVTKGVISKVTWSPWNIVEYYYPDGKPYKDWGTLKDGEGYYNVLDVNGKLCVPCTDKVKKRAAERKK